MTNSTDVLTLSCNLKVPIRYSLGETRKPVAVLSSGYGPSTFDRPLALTIINALEAQGMGWVQYTYPERYADNAVSDLLLSSAILTLCGVVRWTRHKGFTSHILVGNSFGANVSIEASMIDNPACLVLTNPVFDFVEYRSRQIGADAMKTWAERGVTEIEYPKRKVRSYYRFIDEASGQLLLERVGELHTPTLAFQGLSDETQGVDAFREFGKRCRKSTLFELPDAKHTIVDAASLKTISEECSRMFAALE